MNRRHYWMAAMCLMTLAACTQTTKLPENPEDKEEYRDNQGNSWIYNAMLMRWALMPSAMTDFRRLIIIIPIRVRGLTRTARVSMHLRE